jgi:hypothetical protein
LSGKVSGTQTELRQLAEGDNPTQSLLSKQSIEQINLESTLTNSNAQWQNPFVEQVSIPEQSELSWHTGDVAGDGEVDVVEDDVDELDNDELEEVVVVVVADVMIVVFVVNVLSVNGVVVIPGTVV